MRMKASTYKRMKRHCGIYPLHFFMLKSQNDHNVAVDIRAYVFIMMTCHEALKRCEGRGRVEIP